MIYYNNNNNDNAVKNNVHTFLFYLLKSHISCKLNKLNILFEKKNPTHNINHSFSYLRNI